MASQTTDRAGQAASKAAAEVKGIAGDAAKAVADVADDKRPAVADALDTAAETIGEKGKRAPGKRYSTAAKDKLHDAADYVRDHDAEEIGSDAARAVGANPLTSLLLLGAVVIGGSLLVAAMLDNDAPEDSAGESHRFMGLTSAASGLGPKGTETLNRIRDAAISFALAKAVETADEVWPGFREHYERL